MMIFASDNWAGADDAIIVALAKAARDGGPAYGADALTRSVEQRFAEVFEHEVTVFFVATGTAANALALSTYARPGGVVLAHREAHIATDEAGATEFLGGMKIVGLEGPFGKIGQVALAAALDRFPHGSVHHGRPVAVSLTQITEFGAVYRPDEIAGIAEAAHGREAAVHLDGARIAGAIASLGVAPADVTWRAGVDVMSFGGTKNGCIAADAVIFFDRSKAEDFAFLRQRTGHGFSKNWFVAAQFAAYLQGGRWLNLAGHANAMARQLAAAIRRSGRARLALEPDANEVFAVIQEAADAALKTAGATYHEWPGEGLGVAPGADERVVRLVTSFQTTAGEIDRFSRLLG